MKTKQQIRRKIIELIKKEEKDGLKKLLSYLRPKSKRAIEIFKKIADEENLLWPNESRITRYGKRYDIDIKIPSFYSDKKYTKEEQTKIEKYEILKETIKFLSKYYHTHFQIRIVLVNHNETKTWDDECPSYDDLSKLDIMNISTISFSKRLSTTQKARKQAKKGQH